MMTNADADKIKTSYLYAFEREFSTLCGGHTVAARWDQGMWCNAHMYHGQGVEAADGAKRFFDSIMSYPSNRKALAVLRAKHATP